MGELSKLFRWTKKVNIVDSGKVVKTVWVRLVGGDDYQEARNKALKHSKQTRTALKTKGSSEYDAAFTDVDTLGRDDLINAIIVGEVSEYRDAALMAVPEKEPPELPDNPTLEQQEEHATKVEELKQERIKALTEFMEKRGEARRKDFDPMKTEDLRSTYINIVINTRCEEEFSRMFREYQVYKSVYDDADFKKPSFDSFDEYMNSSPLLKNQLLTAYVSLELSGEELKN